jgi:DNA-directed RNA polymerase specialized sigma24 family protein
MNKALKTGKFINGLTKNKAEFLLMAETELKAMIPNLSPEESKFNKARASQIAIERIAKMSPSEVAQIKNLKKYVKGVWVSSLEELTTLNKVYSYNEVYELCRSVSVKVNEDVMQEAVTKIILKMEKCPTEHFSAAKIKNYFFTISKRIIISENRAKNALKRSINHDIDKVLLENEVACESENISAEINSLVKSLHALKATAQPKISVFISGLLNHLNHGSDPTYNPTKMSKYLSRNRQVITEAILADPHFKQIAQECLEISQRVAPKMSVSAMHTSQRAELDKMPTETLTSAPCYSYKKVTGGFTPYVMYIEGGVKKTITGKVAKTLEDAKKSAQNLYLRRMMKVVAEDVNA